jgi:hypothetical protein
MSTHQNHCTESPGGLSTARATWKTTGARSLLNRARFRGRLHRDGFDGQSALIAVLPASLTLTAGAETIYVPTMYAQLDFAHFWHSGCGAKRLKSLSLIGWHKTFIHVQALNSGGPLDG